MQGVFSTPRLGRAIRFHRMMAITGVVSSVFFGVFALLIVQGSKELYWDRFFIFLFSVYLVWLGYRKDINSAHYSKIVQLGYYIFTFQAVWSLLYNDFQFFHLLNFFLVVQVCGFSFRDDRQTLVYYGFVSLVTCGAFFFPSELPIRDKALYLSLIFGSNFLGFIAASMKCRYMHEMKIKESLLLSMVSKTENAIFLTDIYGNIVDLNDRSEQLFGYSRQEVIDRDFKMLRKNDLTKEEIVEGLANLNQERFWNSISSLVTKSGQEIPCRISITLIYSGDRKYMVYRVLDISDAIQKENQIVEEKEKAENAAKAKSQFLAVMSHEIRTPLNGVIATASLLQQTSLDREQTEFVDTIKKSGNSLLMLINDILEFSKMESGKMQLDPHNSSVMDVVFDVMDLLRPHADSKGIQTHIQIAQDVPDKLWMDSHRLKQVLMNLIGNAIKFTEKGSVTVMCESIGIIKRQITIKFTIKDTGIGIKPEKITELFKSFSQVDSSTSRKFGGTGLGLAISKQLVEMMDGSVSVRSNYNMGSEFSFTMKCELEREVGATVIEDQTQTAAIAVDGMKVLVAEDNHINTQVFRFMLQSLNVQTDFVENGVQVLEACSQNTYDLIFMDMQMPEMDGLEATRKLRDTPNFKSIIVAISANAYTDDRKLCMEAGMNDFLPKPFDLDQLRNILIKWSAPKMKKLESAA